MLSLHAFLVEHEYVLAQTVLASLPKILLQGHIFQIILFQSIYQKPKGRSFDIDYSRQQVQDFLKNQSAFSFGFYQDITLHRQVLP